MELVGYADELSALAGERLSFRVSCTAPTFDANLVRLHHGDTQPRAAGLIEEAVPAVGRGTHRGRTQPIWPGSAVVVTHAPSLNCAEQFTISAWIMPTRSGLGARQIISGKGVPGHAGFQFGLDESGRLAVWANDEGEADVQSERPLANGQWYFVAASLHRFGSRQIVQRSHHWSISTTDHVTRTTVRPSVALNANGEPLVFAAMLRGSEQSDHSLHFNGRIAEPQIHSAALCVDDLHTSTGMPAATQTTSSVRGISASALAAESSSMYHPARTMVEP